MISYERFQLDNGLRIVLHRDVNTPLVAVNVLYDVGSKDENPERTGFAHLFEHLMFGGSREAESFDDLIQNAGGECNAFTNSDLTNFFSLLPRTNLELALFLEADRMHQLNVNAHSLEIQRNVVTEEFKETCLNRPYGDLWHLLAPLAYSEHSYKWPTIGQKVDHIREAELGDVQSFYDRFYGPNNAILAISGNIDIDHTLGLVREQFGSINSRHRPERSLKREPEQVALRQRQYSADVPVDSLTMAFHMGGRRDVDYYSADLLSDVLGSGKSSRLHQRLVKEKGICTEADAFITGTTDPGLFIVEAKPADEFSLEDTENEIWAMLEELSGRELPERELERHKNKIESSILFANSSVLNKTMNLAYFELIDAIDLINTEHQEYARLTAGELQSVAAQMFRKDNCSILYYKASQLSMN